MGLGDKIASKFTGKDEHSKSGSHSSHHDHHHEHSDSKELPSDLQNQLRHGEISKDEAFERVSSFATGEPAGTRNTYGAHGEDSYGAHRTSKDTPAQTAFGATSAPGYSVGSDHTSTAKPAQSSFGTTDHSSSHKQHHSENSIPRTKAFNDPQDSAADAPRGSNGLNSSSDNHYATANQFSYSDSGIPGTATFDDSQAVHGHNSSSHSGVFGGSNDYTSRSGFSTGDAELDSKISKLDPKVQEQAKEAYQRGYKDAQSAFKA